jgi:hypothetical protein
VLKRKRNSCRHREGGVLRKKLFREDQKNVVVMIMRKKAHAPRTRGKAKMR